MIKLNLNSLLVILGGLGVFAPDVTSIAAWLDNTHIHWVSYVAKALGFVSVFFAAAPLAVPKLRAFLALFGLATPAGTVVPSPMPPKGGLFKRFTVTLKRSDGISERQPGTSVFRMNWSEREVLTRLRADGYPIGASATLSGWPSSKFGVRSMQGLLILEDTDPRESSNWGGQSEDAASQPSSGPSKKDGGFAQHKTLWICGLLALVVYFGMLVLYMKMAEAVETEVSPVTMPVLPEIHPIVPLPPPPAEAKPSTPATPTVVPAPATPTPIDTDYPTPKLDLKSRYGACSGNICLAPAFALQAFQYVPSTGDMIGGVAFAGGYGVVWHTLVDLGLAVYGGVQFSRDKPFQAQGLAMINIANYIAFGPGFQMVGQTEGPAKFLMTICFAANWIPGLNQGQ